MEGQRKLKGSSVLVVGTGGLGSPAALYLAAAGVGRLGLVDFDVVEASNLQRQVLHGTSTLGMPKVESARQRLHELNPNIEIDTYNVILSSDNALEIADSYDMLLDGTDNFPTRYLINDLCVLTGKPFVYGSIFRFEGQVSVFDAPVGGCYRCLFPEPPPPHSVPSCGQAGVFGVLPGIVGSLQAAEAIKYLLGIGESLVGRLALFDALDMSWQTIKLRKNPKCKACGEEPYAEITELIDYENFCGSPVHEVVIGPDDWQVDVGTLSEMLKNGQPLQLVDVREGMELTISSLPGAVQISYGELGQRAAELDPAIPVVLFCRTGIRSSRAVQILRGAGHPTARSLRGGINAWAEQIDPDLLQY